MNTLAMPVLKMRLSDLTAEFIDAVSEMAEIEDLTEQEFLDTIESFKLDIKQKAINLCLRVQSIEQERNKLIKQIKTLQVDVDKKNKRIDMIKFYIIKYLVHCLNKTETTISELKNSGEK
jgi:septal ring factor EnvC (AmiA/AmiB activator)